MRRAWLALCLLTCAPAARAQTDPAPVEVDLKELKGKLRVFSDGKGHYLALPPLPASGLGGVYTNIFYGDARTLYRQRVGPAGRTGDRQSFVIAEPRYEMRGPNASIADGKLTLLCGERQTVLPELKGQPRSALLAAATFREVAWRRASHLLARDNRGLYYLVDAFFEQQPNNGRVIRSAFRVFVGPRGRMKQLKMKNVVQDASGEVFITPRGKLRLVIERSGGEEAAPRPGAIWISGGRSTALTVVDLGVPTTPPLIYRELGVYSSVKLHRPCDDL